MCELVRAERALTIVPHGSKAHRRIKAGTVLCANDPLVRGRERLFVPVRVQHHCELAGGGNRAPVEQATAAPGELRTVAPPLGSEPAVYACDEPDCDATAKSPAGLAAHKRGHARNGGD